MKPKSGVAAAQGVSTLAAWQHAIDQCRGLEAVLGPAGRVLLLVFWRACVLTCHFGVLQDTPAYEVLYQESSIINQKLTEKRAEREAERNKQCTFAPTLVSQQLVKEGRVMKVRVVRAAVLLAAGGKLGCWTSSTYVLPRLSLVSCCDTAPAKKHWVANMLCVRPYTPACRLCVRAAGGVLRPRASCASWRAWPACSSWRPASWATGSQQQTRPRWTAQQAAQHRTRQLRQCSRVLRSRSSRWVVWTQAALGCCVCASCWQAIGHVCPSFILQAVFLCVVVQHGAFICSSLSTQTKLSPCRPCCACAGRLPARQPAAQQPPA